MKNWWFCKPLREFGESQGKDLQIRFAKSGELDIEGDFSNIQPGRR